jgi:hypothetical protein
MNEKWDTKDFPNGLLSLFPRAFYTCVLVLLYNRITFVYMNKVNKETQVDHKGTLNVCVMHFNYWYYNLLCIQIGLNKQADSKCPLYFVCIDCFPYIDIITFW